MFNHSKKLILFINSSNQQINITENIVKDSNKNFTIILMDENLSPLLYQKLPEGKKYKLKHQATRVNILKAIN